MAVIQKQYNYMAFPQAFSRGNGIPLDNSSRDKVPSIPFI